MKNEANETEIVKPTLTTIAPTTRAAREAKRGKAYTSKDGKKKSARSTGSYSVSGRKVDILQTNDKHKLWADLFAITESQIGSLKAKIEAGQELDPKDMNKLDSCYGGMKKLLEIEAQLKSDAIASMTTEELKRMCKKSLREST